ncbi:MAG: hypothetical protein AAF702_42815 [Chloroflexota bacterium]
MYSFREHLRNDLIMVTGRDILSSVERFIKGIIGRFTPTAESSTKRRYYQQVAKEANMIEAVIWGNDLDGWVEGIAHSKHGGVIFYELKAANEKSRKGIISIGDERWTSLFTEARPSGETIPARLDTVRLVLVKK